jgi:hypothetical protein
MMAKQQQDDQPTMRGPAIYRIRVGGRVDPRWADRVSGMQITNLTHLRGNTESVLVGRLADQSALNGVLTALYDRHLPVISVEYLEGQEFE